MADYFRQSPWTDPANDLGLAFGRLMLNMAQLRGQQAEAGAMNQYRQGQLQQGADELEARRPLYEAQAGAQKASGEKDEMETERLREILSQAARFGQASRGAFAPQVDMSQGPTVDAGRALSLGDLLQSRGVLTALNPSALAQAVTPVEANANTVIGDPMTGREIFRGPEMQRPVTLAPGAQMFAPQGGAPLASNTNPRAAEMEFDSPAFWARVLPTMLNQAASLGVPQNEYMDAPIVQNPALGNLFTNALKASEMGLGRMLQAPQGTNATAAAPQSTGPVRVTTKQQHDALPPGTQYIGPDGKVATKK